MSGVDQSKVASHASAAGSTNEQALRLRDSVHNERSSLAGVGDDALPSAAAWATARTAYLQARAPDQLLPRLRADYATAQAGRAPMTWRWLAPTAAAATALVVMLLVGIPRQFITGSHRSSHALPAVARATVARAVPATQVAAKGRGVEVVSQVATASKPLPANAVAPTPTLTAARALSHEALSHQVMAHVTEAPAPRAALASLQRVNSSGAAAGNDTSVLSELRLTSPPSSSQLRMPSKMPSMPSLSGLQLPAFPSTAAPALPVDTDDRAEAPQVNSSVTA